MKNVLEPLTRIPGVRLSALVSHDGVPIDVRSNAPAKPRPAPTTPAPAERATSAPSEAPIGADDINVLSALASSWVAEMARSVAPMSWDVPKRLVLQAARGTLVLVQAPRAILLVVLDAGVGAEELRLPMGVAIARLERHLRAANSKGQERSAEPAPRDPGPPGIFPAPTQAHQTANTVHATGNEAPEVPGE